MPGGTFNQKHKQTTISEHSQKLLIKNSKGKKKVFFNLPRLIDIKYVKYLINF